MSAEKENKELLRKIELLEKENADLKRRLEKSGNYAERIENEAVIYKQLLSLASDYSYSHRVCEDGSLEAEFAAGFFEVVTGYTPKELDKLGGFAKLIHPEDLPKAIDRVQRQMKGETVTSELRIITKSGEIKYMRDRGAPGWSDDGKRVVRLFGAAVEVTGQKNLERELKESQERFYALFQNMKSGVAVYKPTKDGKDFKFIDFNSAAESITNIDKKKAVGNNLLELFPNMEMTPLFRSLRKANETGEPIHIKPFYYEDSVRQGWRENYIYKLPSGDIVAIFDDVTAEMEALEDLKKSEGKYRQLFEFMPIGVTIANLDGEIVDANKEAERLLGLSKEEQKQRNIDGEEWRIVRVDGSTMPAEEFPSVRALKENKAISGVRMGIVKGEKETSWINVSAAPYNYDGKGAVIAYVDVTPQVEAERSLRKSNATKDAFFSIVAHDLKAPISGMISLTESCVKGLKRFSLNELNDVFDKLHSNSLHLYKALENLLLWSRLNRNLVEYNPMSLNLREFADEAKTLFDFKAKTKHIDIVNNIPPGIFVFVDNGMIQSVFRNLTSNALSFTRFGGKVEFDAETRDDCAIVSVKDSGVGISRDDIPKLLNIEIKYAKEGTAGEQGTGLGLALCMEFLKKHDSELRLESKVGVGSKFSFNLPLKDLSKK